MNTIDVNKAAGISDREGKTNLEQVIQESLTEARATCSQNGNQSQECAVAWDIVEELQAEKAHRKQQQVRFQTSLDHYCYMHPDAIECRIYDI